MSKVESYPERIPGIWWFSDDPSKTVPGDLLVKDRKLELNGSLEGIKRGAIGIGKPGLVHARQDRTILGVARNGGKHFTLEYFDEPSFSWATPGYKADTYTLGKIFDGDHFTRTDNLAFERYYVEIPQLLEWVNESVITVQMTIPDSNKDRMAKDTSFKIEIGGARSIKVFKGATFQLSFEIYPEGLRLSAPVKDMRISQRCVVKIEALGKKLDFVEAGSLLAHFERFLAIATGRTIEPLKYQASSGKGGDSKTVTILTGAKSSKQQRDLSIHEMNFSFSDIAKDSQTLFEKWFQDLYKHTDMFDLFSAIRSTLPKNLNNQFRDIVSALEGYVCVESGKTEVSPDKAVKTLNERLPKEDRPVSGTDYNKIRITRNKLSHVTIRPEDEAYILGDSDKWANIQRMTFLLEYSLLKGLGLSEAMLTKFYKKRKIYL